jgi:hypothetical protein
MKPPPPPDEVAGVTEVANSILSATGNMDIYQETFESIKFKVSFVDVDFRLVTMRLADWRYILP